MNDESTIPNSGCDPPPGSGPGGSNPDEGIQFTPDESTAASTIGAQLDYKLLRLIGRGAYGEVWLARDKRRAFRAVKVVFRASFDHDRPYEREYDGIRKFEPISRSYDHQVQILHVGRQDEQGRFYYIMELADDQHTGQQIEPQTYVPKTLRASCRVAATQLQIVCVSPRAGRGAGEPAPARPYPPRHRRATSSL